MLRVSSLAAAPGGRREPVVVPLRRIVDPRAHSFPSDLNRFWQVIWPEAVRDFASGGIRFDTTDAAGEIRRSAADRPLFHGLEPGVLNLVLTGTLPLYWDSGQALAGVTTRFEGYHLCVIAVRYAHRNQVPYLSVNTCLHEILHALMGDVFISQPKWYQRSSREMRIDLVATGLWLFGDGAAVGGAARTYVQRLKTAGR